MSVVAIGTTGPAAHATIVGTGTAGLVVRGMGGPGVIGRAVGMIGPVGSGTSVVGPVVVLVAAGGPVELLGAALVVGVGLLVLGVERLVERVRVRAVGLPVRGATSGPAVTSVRGVTTAETSGGTSGPAATTAAGTGKISAVGGTTAGIGRTSVVGTPGGAGRLIHVDG
ncbi:hypothetical protein [Kribbella solani]|uniref:hypothetical protein n=1 Tax=Kribbella solani TaxID=236067 RepID=UPI0029BC15BC|nr:hypothetical protein [Kribbella solani]MDX2974670.1 hypothetical protein [Kribbella solani]